MKFWDIAALLRRFVLETKRLYAKPKFTLCHCVRKLALPIQEMKDREASRNRTCLPSRLASTGESGMDSWPSVRFNQGPKVMVATLWGVNRRVKEKPKLWLMVTSELPGKSNRCALYATPTPVRAESIRLICPKRR